MDGKAENLLRTVEGRLGFGAQSIAISINILAFASFLHKLQKFFEPFSFSKLFIESFSCRKKK